MVPTIFVRRTVITVAGGRAATGSRPVNPTRYRTFGWSAVAEPGGSGRLADPPERFSRHLADVAARLTGWSIGNKMLDEVQHVERFDLTAAARIA